MKSVLMVGVGLLALVGLFALLNRFGQDSRERAWENRRRIGFQPMPADTVAA